MEHFIIYLAKAAGLTGIFYLAYHFLLRKETFFTPNRWFLIAGLFTSILLPFGVYTKTVWVDPKPRVAYQEIDLDELMMMHDAVATATTEPAVSSISINWFDVTAGIYLAGALFFLIRFIIEIISLRRMLIGNAIVKESHFLLVDSPAVQSPFSFFNYIVYNSAALLPDELESILCHEKVHSRQRHSLDMVISQLFCIAFWFNPLAWMYRKSISQNLEFIADSEAARQIADRQAYQKTLLKITVHPECIAITNHFYQSLIKKRIVMLNKQQSKKRNSWKYAIILPALSAFMLAFQVRVVAQEKTTTQSSYSSKMSVSVEVHKDSKDDELKAESQVFKQQFDTDVNFENVKRNTKNEITGIKVTVKDKAQSKVYEVAGTEPITPFTIEVEKGSATDKNNISFGKPRKLRDITAKVYRYDTDTDSIHSNRNIVIARGEEMPVPPVPPVPNAPLPPGAVYGTPGNLHIQHGTPAPTVIATGNEETLIVINGVRQEKRGTLSLPFGEEIVEFRVLKDRDAKDKYGKDGKKGVVEITTRRTAHNLRGNGRITMLNGNDIDLDVDLSGLADLDFSSFSKLGELANLKELGVLGDFRFDGEFFTEADQRHIQAELARAGEEIKRAMADIDASAYELSDKEREEIRKEMIAARKEIMEARKEMMKEMGEARKEIMKERKEAIKQREKARKENTAETKKTMTKKA